MMSVVPVTARSAGQRPLRVKTLRFKTLRIQTLRFKTARAKEVDNADRRVTSVWGLSLEWPAQSAISHVTSERGYAEHLLIGLVRSAELCVELASVIELEDGAVAHRVNRKVEREGEATLRALYAPLA